MHDVCDPSDADLDAHERALRTEPRAGGMASLAEVLEGALGSHERRFYTEEEIRRRTQPSPAEARLDRRERLDRSGILPMLTKRGLAAIVDDRAARTPALAQVRSWVSGVGALGEKEVLGVFGPTDAGKTVAAAWALARHDGVYIESNALCVHRGTLYRPADATYARCLTASLLVVDELGAEDDQGVAAATIREVINRRLRAKKTLLLGNLTESDWMRLVDARTRSRLEEVGDIFATPHAGLRRPRG